MTDGNNLSFEVAGSLSRFAWSSSAAAANMASRNRETSSSANLSSTSSSSLRFFFDLLAFFGFKMASSFISSRAFRAASCVRPHNSAKVRCSHHPPEPSHLAPCHHIADALAVCVFWTCPSPHHPWSSAASCPLPLAPVGRTLRQTRGTHPPEVPALWTRLGAHHDL